MKCLLKGNIFGTRKGKRNMYDYFVSLGWYCGVAASMSKYGLRSFSGPFDWYYSNFKGVIHFLETDFEDYLQRDNLRRVEEKNKDFKDVKYDMYYNHDIYESFEKEYDDIHNKYLRRIDRFRDIMDKKICFIRAVRNQEELDYIWKNESYINRVIKKGNDRSEIIYLVPQYMNIPSNLKSKYFILPINQYRGNTIVLLRSLFDDSKELVKYCIEHSDSDSRECNMMFEQEKNIRKLDSLERRHALLLHILKTDYSKIVLPNKIAIYGAGDNGKIFYEKVKNRCNVICFIDASPKEQYYDGVHIISLDNYIAKSDVSIIITPIYEKDEIAANLKAVCKSEIEIIPIDRVLI